MQKCFSTHDVQLTYIINFGEYKVNIFLYFQKTAKDKFLYDETTVCQHMKNCNTLCQALYDEKIWYCSVACIILYHIYRNNDADKLCFLIFFHEYVLPELDSSLYILLCCRNYIVIINSWMNAWNLL